MRIRATVAVAALLSLIAARVEAQQGAAQNPVELGIDGQISFGLDDQGTGINIPVNKVRAGFAISPAITLEPALGFQRTPFGDASINTLNLDMSMLYHFSPNRAARQFYVRPLIGIWRVTGSGSSVSSTNLGVAGGMKVPLMDRLAARFETEFRHYLESAPVPSGSELNLNFGVSYFTR